MSLADISWTPTQRISVLWIAANLFRSSAKLKLEKLVAINKSFPSHCSPRGNRWPEFLLGPPIIDQLKANVQWRAEEENHTVQIQILVIDPFFLSDSYCLPICLILSACLGHAGSFFCKSLGLTMDLGKVISFGPSLGTSPPYKQTGVIQVLLEVFTICPTWNLTGCLEEFF